MRIAISGMRDVSRQDLPVINVQFDAPYSLAIKVCVLSNLSANWRTVEPGVLHHMGDDIIDYWLERSGDLFYVSGADWAGDFVEIQVS